MADHRVQRLTRNRIWGLGVYINPDHYRYAALQLGPLWLYVWHEAGYCRRARPKPNGEHSRGRG